MYARNDLSWLNLSDRVTRCFSYLLTRSFHVPSSVWVIVNTELLSKFNVKMIQNFHRDIATPFFAIFYCLYQYWHQNGERDKEITWLVPIFWAGWYLLVEWSTVLVVRISWGLELQNYRGTLVYRSGRWSGTRDMPVLLYRQHTRGTWAHHCWGAQWWSDGLVERGPSLLH